MKIGIITPYDSANYGAYLQAYASKRYLESLGHQVVFIKFRAQEARKKVFYKKAETIKELVCNILRKPHYDKNYHVMTEALAQFEIVDAKAVAQAGVNALVVGSDEIWNINVNTFKNPIFYGAQFKDILTMAYAPSAGNANVADYAAYPQHIAGLGRVKIIGVRDKNTQNIIKELCAYTPDIVCDPTCLLEAKDYNIASQSFVKEPYLLVYSYYVAESIRVHLKKYAKENNLKLVAACMYQSWCDYNICCSPLEFCGLIKDAACVFTTTFHGSIFTLMQHKKCAIEAKSKKVADLMEWTGMEKVTVTSKDTYEHLREILNHLPDYIAYDAAMQERRNHSRGLYQQALEEI